MNTRRESCLDRLKVKCLIDPLLRSSAARVRLKTASRGEGGWLRLALRHFINPTILPPPSYTRARADDVYGPAFRRCIEFVTRNRLRGDVLEFGTLLGYTARWWAALMREYDHAGALWLFDSFEGLPEITATVDQQSYEVAVNRVWFRGAMKVDSEIHIRIGQTLRRILPPGRVHVIKGYFENTLRDNLPTQPVALLHLDCDLYSSAKTRWQLQAAGCSRVIITRGEQGCCVLDGDQLTHLPAHRVAAVDATAAGDVFSGALATALSEGRTLIEAARWASAAAAISVTRRGAQPSIPSREEIDRQGTRIIND